MNKITCRIAVFAAATALLCAAAVPAAETDKNTSRIQIANVNAFYSGGEEIGGTHPHPYCSWTFTVPEGNNRLLLVSTQYRYSDADAGIGPIPPLAAIFSGLALRCRTSVCASLRRGLFAGY